MGKYVLKRILIMIPTLLVVIFIIFALINIMPGDPGRIMLGQDAAQEDVDAINAMLRMDKPLVVRLYIWDALHLDFGISLLTRQPVFSDLFAKIPITFILALGGTVTSVLIGVPLGVISAVKEHTLLDSSLSVISLLIAAIPSFWMSIMMILLFSATLHLLPSSGIGTPLHYVMPILSLGLHSPPVFEVVVDGAGSVQGGDLGDLAPQAHAAFPLRLWVCGLHLQKIVDVAAVEPVESIVPDHPSGPGLD